MSVRFSKAIFMFTYMILFISCNDKSIEGLWVIEKVQVGSEEMTPKSRWVRFNMNNTQESGNGWYQHSIGTWNFDEEKMQLNIINTNGYKDTNGPFSISIEEDQMYWNRNEGGANVTVTLKRAIEIPQSDADKLLGVWDLKEVVEDSLDVTYEYDPTQKQYMFIRWDKIFMLQHTPEGRQMGIYRTHGQIPEIEMVYYSEENLREKWMYSFDKNRLIFSSVGTEKNIKIVYERIDYFPE